ncbi:MULTISPECIES: exopolysaccharide biosynthesis protein [unclassified Luteimonas]|uniref:exopolysaccharide biosynthesis protein n=1 Tax=unclassified Luteimonas TaxID=2629088 RepID=UPI0018F0EEF4|nr:MULTISPECIES: exopolysaccharide biosynthesis protein [unclassified Luteimonas]MBJ6980411.1 exopolysaccharide biosynthesis protein [Luteimonas sp. MC1572]MBJ7574320.1 exopolysaccharide biosynthesis protein [Luteimonas sp. MC1828]QQO04293.1 exopolysaccharide biosynthesis protein [Luteimonas sp. MC1572]
MADHDGTGRRTHAKPPQASVRTLLATLVAGPEDEALPLRTLLDGLGRSMFGMLLFIATLPAFLPIPGLAGALSGPLVSLVGLQLLLGLRRPWLPGFVARRGPRRGTLARFEHRISPWLARLEHLVRPRLAGLIDHRAATMFTGVLLVLLGVLLALPIPFTNYVFGVLLLAYALALLERDGVLLLVSWGAGLAAIVIFGVTGGTLAALATEWIDRLF